MKTFTLRGLNIHIFGGWKEIGGNQILLETEKGSIFLDFGRPFLRWDKWFTEFLAPRPAYGLRDILALQLLPPMRGLYRDGDEDTLFPGDMEHQLLKDGPRGDHVKAVLLSHAHLDHAGAISYLRRDLPIVASAITAAVIKALQDTGQGGLEREMAYFSLRQRNEEGVLKSTGNSYVRRPYLLFDGSLPAFCGLSPAKRKEIEGPSWESVQRLFSIGPFRIEAFPVDHSVPGATAYVVETSAGYVVYTGDFRIHGLQKKCTEDFLCALEKKDVLLLVIEGTRLGEQRHTYTEGEVRAALHDVVSQNPTVPVVVDFSPRNLDRLFSCLEVGEDVGRFLVLTPKDAYLLFALMEASPYGETLKKVLVLKEPKATSESGWESKLWEHPAVRGVTMKEIAEDPGRFILAFGFYEVNRLLDLRLLMGFESTGVYIFSNSYLADEEQRLDLCVLLNWLYKLKFRVLPEGLAELPSDPSALDNPFHSSGHAPEKVLAEVVQRIRPRFLLPVHTENPTRWLELASNVKLLLD